MVVYDLRGQMLLQLGRTDGQLDISHLANGTYIVEAHMNDQVLRKQFIIAR